MSAKKCLLPGESDHAKTVMEAAKAIDKVNVDEDLSDLINYISELFRFIEEKEKVKKKGNNQSKPKGTKNYWPWPRSIYFSRLKEVLSEGVEGIKDVPTGDAKKFAQEFVKGVGMVHMATAGFLVVAYILERCEAISTNKGACLSILKEMDKLARHVNELRKRPELKEGMVDSIREAIALIVEASIACCTQINATKFSKFFSTTVDGEELSKFQERLTKLYTHMQENFNLCLYDAIVRPRKPIELQYPEHPSYAVGIEKPLKKVIELLECGSDKNVVAVTLHGFGGMGKTTLADAVFVRLLNAQIEGCRYSYVRLFDDITSVPDVVKLQKFIIKALKMGEEPKEFQRYEEGQLQIKSILEKEMVFIYIDNVLRSDALERLLQKEMGKYARKLRLLLTARDKGAVKISGVETKFYRIEGLHAEEALELLKNTLDDDRKKQLNPSHLNQMVKICGGVPKLLDVVTGFINNYGETALQAYNTVLEESQKNWKGEVGNDIETYVFAFDKLEDNLKYPFLDICSYFQGWDWKEVADIVGNSDLEKLEKRALVTRDVKTMTARVHDVILEVGLKKTKGERLRLTSATEIDDFLEIEDEDLKKIKGIWASDNKVPLRIPAKKLDLMCGSLTVLKLGPLTDVEGKCEKKFNELVFFCATISHLPFDMSKFKKFNKLAHLCYHPEDLQNLSQMPSTLRHIEFVLNSPAFEISSKDCTQQLSNLRVLRLTNALFKSLPKELGDLVNGLEELSLSGCKYLEELPASVSRLGSLRVLRMFSCSGLTQLPEDLRSLNSLQELYLRGCKSLETLPRNLESLTSLKKLDVSECVSLKELPCNLGKLTSLQELHLYDCDSLQALPISLEELSSLRLLDLHNCSGIKDLPCGLAKLTSLAKLNLDCCRQLSTIPESIGQLKLNSINLGATPLKGLPDGFCKFSTLTELDMTGCRLLEKLPERFGEIKSLRKLQLRNCICLKKLPESFSQLNYLEVLSLEYCKMLQKLPEDFHCLASLEVLDVRNCYKLEGKWIDSMLKMKTLQILRIGGSRLLEERWEKIRGQSDHSWPCAVHTNWGLSNEENLLQQLQSKFDSMLTNGEGKPLNISGRPLNTLLLVMFDGRQEFRPDFPLPLLEENIDDFPTHFEMVYFGNHWDQLPKKVANRILGHAPVNRDAKALFEKLLSLVDHFQTDFDSVVTGSFQMTAEIVINSDKYLRRWERVSNVELEDFVVTKCGRYLKLKQLAEIPQENNMELLREFFPSGEPCFVKKGALTKVGVDELQGKTILLDIRPANVCYDIPLRALVEMYNVDKEKFNFEIITVPIIQRNTTTLDVSEKFSREVPWLVLQNPWLLKNTTKYFLVEGCPRWFGRKWDMWYPNTMRIIKSDGRIAPYNNPGVLRMVNTWGAAAYPFTAEKAEELIQKEKTQIEAMSDAMFLFHHLECVSEQLKKATRQKKMICLYEKEFTNAMKDVLTELSDVIYLIYIPIFGILRGRELVAEFTFTRWCAIWEPSKMSPAEMQSMFLVNLSE